MALATPLSTRTQESTDADRRMALRRRRVRQEIVVRVGIALLVLVFNEVLGFTTVMTPNSVIRVISIFALVLAAPYILLARLDLWPRQQAYVRMMMDLVLITIGMYGAGGLSAAPYLAIYSVDAIYAGIVLSARACIVATSLSTVAFLGLVALQQAGVLLHPEAGGPMWVVAAFNVILLNVIGGLTAFLSGAYRESRRRMQASEARFRTLAESAGDAIISTDEAGRIIMCNRSAERMFESDADAMRGTPLADLLAVRDRKSLRDLMDGSMPNRVGREAIELEGVRRTGEEVPIELSLSSWTTAEGRFFGAIIRDITERKQVEGALRDSEQRFRTLFEDARVGIYRATPEGEILLANPAFVQMLGCDSAAQLIADSGARQTASGDVKGRSAPFAARSPGSEEVEWRRHDGHMLTVRETRTVVHAEDGSTRYVEGIVEDVTERKRLEEQLRQSQKLDAIGRLAGGVAHDFNNILTAILGYGDLLGRRNAREDFVRTAGGEIVAAAERGATLIRQLLTFSRGQPFQPTTLNLNTIVRDLERMLRRLIREDIELVATLDPDLGPVKADAGQIEQVLLNLVVNARDAMPSGGRIIIETAMVEVGASATTPLDLTPGPYVMLAVKDTGAGIAPDIQAHIFEPFFTTKAPDKGTGLGLSTVYGIVKQSHGSVVVQSEPGHGATFTIYLPSAKAPLATAAVGRPGSALTTGSETILLVEDDSTVRYLTEQILSGSGYTVVAAATGAEALKICAERTGTIDLLLTDWVMPQMNGWELAARVMQISPTLPVLFMSGYTQGGVELHEGSQLRDVFLPKPFTPSALTRKVRDVLDASSRKSAATDAATT